MGRFEEAVEYLQQYLDVDPNATDRANIEENIRRLKRSIRDRFQELSVSSDPPGADIYLCLLYTSPSPRDQRGSRMPSSA